MHRVMSQVFSTGLFGRKNCLWNGGKSGESDGMGHYDSEGRRGMGGISEENV